MEKKQKNACSGCQGSDHPFVNLPWLPDAGKNASLPSPPTDEECFRLWDKYGMLDNVRAHSLLVAHIATAMARRAASLGLPVSVPETRASALLHDLAKTWCLRYGGSHALLGAAWTVAETGNYRIGQGVILHVHWPWQLPDGPAICSLPFFVIYADKRVRHDKCVTLSERFEDLLVRYGHTEQARAGIRSTYGQAKEMEALLAKYLEWSLDENTFDCGRLV